MKDLPQNSRIPHFGILHALNLQLSLTKNKCAFGNHFKFIKQSRRGRGIWIKSSIKRNIYHCTKYTIYDVDRIEGRENIIGRSHYDDRTIYVEHGSYSQMLYTLKHELMHVWMYENGHQFQIDGCFFGYEDVCELVAYSNDFINKVVNIYVTTHLEK